MKADFARYLVTVVRPLPRSARFGHFCAHDPRPSPFGLRPGSPGLRSWNYSGSGRRASGVYNLVRLEMVRIAEEAQVAPNRSSFVMALRLIRDEWLWSAVASPGAIPRHLRELRAEVLHFVLPPRRSERRYPRTVKFKMSSYDLKRRVAK